MPGNHSQTSAPLAIADELASMSIDASAYSDDVDYSECVDRSIAAKLKSLSLYLNQLGFPDLATSIADSLEKNDSALTILEISKSYYVPEIRRLLDAKDSASVRHSGHWAIIHPNITAVSKPRFDSGHFSDAVEAAFKEFNARVKKIVLEQTREEHDGAKLMRKAFDGENPAIRISALISESERNEQSGYGHIAAGAMQGIRNPKAHANMQISPERAVHLLFLSSLLMYRLDERIN